MVNQRGEKKGGSVLVCEPARAMIRCRRTTPAAGRTMYRIKDSLSLAWRAIVTCRERPKTNCWVRCIRCRRRPNASSQVNNIFEKEQSTNTLARPGRKYLRRRKEAVDKKNTSAISDGWPFLRARCALQQQPRSRLLHTCYPRMTLVSLRNRDVGMHARAGLRAPGWVKHTCSVPSILQKQNTHICAC